MLSKSKLFSESNDISIIESHRNRFKHKMVHHFSTLLRFVTSKPLADDVVHLCAIFIQSRNCQTSYHFFVWRTTE